MPQPRTTTLPSHDYSGCGPIQADLTNLSFEHLPAGLVITAANGFLVAIVMTWVSGPLAPWGWFTALLLILYARMLLLRRYRADPTALTCRQWTSRFAFGATATGLAWGLSVLLLPKDNLTYQVFLGFVISGMVAGAIPSLSPNPLAYRAYLLAALVPFAVRMALVGDQLAMTFTLLIALFGTFMWLNAGRYRATLVRSLELGHANQTLVDELTRERDRIATLNQELKGEVKERRATQQALVQAKEQAESANVSKSQFVANMSHEIRTPMNGVLGMIEMLTQTQMNTQQRGFLDIARSSAESLLTIINDILDFSKIEAGKVDLESIPFDVRLLAEDVATLFTASAQSQGIELACFVEPKLHSRVIGDPTRLRQILTNVLGNAVKFTQHGEVLLRVSADGGTPERPVMCFEVRDTGIGMSPAQMERLFQPFVQADGTTTRRFGGSGLGLAISKNLVELMGGSLEVRSRLGEGSGFLIRIGFEPQTLPQEPPPQNGLDGLRMLAVDDHPTNLEILGHYLRGWGIHFEGVDRADQAIDRLLSGAAEGKPFDVAILDLQMPQMDGLTLARAIRSEPALSDTHLLLLSSGGNPPRTSGAPQAVDLSLGKPVRQALLRDALFQLTHGATPGQSVAPPAKDHEDDENHLNGRVLLAEDNPINQKVACGMLHKLGLWVDIAQDGEQALARLRNAGQPYDLVLMDVQMPIMDGFAATQALRQMEQDQGLERMPVIAMTANAMTGDRERCMQAGMDDYIPKPVRIAELRRTLSRWVHQQSAE